MEVTENGIVFKPKNGGIFNGMCKSDSLSVELGVKHEYMYSVLCFSLSYAAP